MCKLIPGQNCLYFQASKCDSEGEKNKSSGLITPWRNKQEEVSPGHFKGAIRVANQPFQVADGTTSFCYDLSQYPLVVIRVVKCGHHSPCIRDKWRPHLFSLVTLTLSLVPLKVKII